MGIEACEAAMPGTPNVAVFDTAFGMAMPEKAYLTPFLTSTMRSTASAATASTAPATGLSPTRLSSSAAWIRRTQR
ncbi:MAG: hypothetical protein V8S98_02270 [Lachnospiraceae bacterium]